MSFIDDPQYLKDISTFDPKYDDMEERRVILGMETRTARTLNRLFDKSKPSRPTIRAKFVRLRNQQMLRK